MKRRFFALLFLPLLISSCAKVRKEQVANNAFADMLIIPDGFVAGSSFSVTAETTDNPMLAKEVARKIEKLMQDKGYVVTSRQNAEYHLTFNFAMTPLKTTVQSPKIVTGFTQKSPQKYLGKSCVCKTKPTKSYLIAIGCLRSGRKNLLPKNSSDSGL